MDPIRMETQVGDESAWMGRTHIQDTLPIILPASIDSTVVNSVGCCLCEDVVEVGRWEAVVLHM
jgi:hypothetical protein